MKKNGQHVHGLSCCVNTYFLNGVTLSLLASISYSLGREKKKPLSFKIKTSSPICAAHILMSVTFQNGT